METAFDTIAAIGTAPGEAGIAVVRVSGPASLGIADRLFRCKGLPPSARPAFSFVHGFVVAAAPSRGTGELDEAVLLIYRAPQSYTREDVVEFQCHGGRVCAKRVLRAVLGAGARPAAPGEFTKRAFLNGRIDLVQAEAVCDLIRAKSDLAASAALDQLDGSLSDCLQSCYDSVMACLSRLEASLDFPEEDIPASIVVDASRDLAAAKGQLQGLIDTFDEGRLLRDGAVVVISGKPNVGKSTLMNLLLGRDRSIVTATPGTTRDTIEEELTIGGVPIRLVDTAGLRKADCEVEQEGVRRATESIATADINLHVIDGSVAADADEFRDLNCDRSKRVVILSKLDLGLKFSPDVLADIPYVKTCLLHDQDIAAIRAAILRVLDITIDRDPHSVISERHRYLISCALEDIHEAESLLDTQGEIVLACSSLRSSAESLCAITGRIFSEDLLDRIFSGFCIGK